jgi:hypothetical protein
MNQSNNDSLISFEPENKLEEILIGAQKGTHSFDELVNSFITEDIYVPSGNAINADWSGFSPLLFRRHEKPMIAVFTAVSRTKLYIDKAPYCLSIKAIAFLSRIAKGNGVVVNPGYRVGMEINQEGIEEILDRIKGI